MTHINILIVDDHHLMIEGYKSILSYNKSEIEVHITTANNCEDGFKIITNPLNSQKFDVVFLDRGLPAYEKENLKTGEDLAYLIKKHMPETKIVILTSHAEAFILYNIVKKIKPSGLLVKSDFTADDFLMAFEKIMSDEIYYSPTVKQYIRELNSQDSYLDNYNRQIISCLAQGIKTKNLPDHLPLSMSAIDKRKVQIKDYFNIEKGNDEDIIREAKKAGFI